MKRRKISLCKIFNNFSNVTFVNYLLKATNMNKRELTREEIIGLIAEFRSEVKKNTAK